MHGVKYFSTSNCEHLESQIQNFALHYTCKVYTEVAISFKISCIIRKDFLNWYNSISGWLLKSKAEIHDFSKTFP